MKESGLAETSQRAVKVGCVASHFKGADFLRECKRQGARVELLTRERTRHEPWPHDSLDAVHHLPDDAGAELVAHAAAHLSREQKIDALVALEEFDVVTTARAREHLRLPGLDSSRARLFRDKLAMRQRARESSLRVPDFVPLFNYQEVGEYMERVPPPWVVKPRSDVSSSGIRRLEESEQVWRAIEALDAREALQDKSSYYLLEKFVAGEVFHVDSVVEEGEVIFSGASRYGRPPLDVAQGGGVFTTHTLDYDSAEGRGLTRLNAELLRALGLARGERVGRLEPRREYGGIALSLARQERPDTSSYDDPEIVFRVDKPHHVGLVVRSPDLGRVRALLEDYSARFARDFSATVPPPDRRGVNL